MPAANIPQPDTLSSPPLALREAPRRAGSAPNVRREIQRVQSLIGLRWCVFFMRSPGGCCLRMASSRHGAGLLARSKRAQFVPQVNLFLRHAHFHCGKDWQGLISLAPVVRSHVPLPFLQIRRAPACAAGSPKPSLPGAAPGLRAIFPDGGRSVSVSIAGCEPAGAGANPVGLPISFNGPLD